MSKLLIKKRLHKCSVHYSFSNLLLLLFFLFTKFEKYYYYSYKFLIPAINYETLIYCYYFINSKVTYKNILTF